MKSCLVFVISGFIVLMSNIRAQDKLYSNEFPLSDVTLLEGPFKHAQDLNVTTLLQYDVDRLLAPYFKEAGLTPKGESYENWIGLDGHIGGHYLSALAIHYAATGNFECKQRMDYMITELKACQEANGADTNFTGYIGGVPDGKPIWLEIMSGDPSAIWDGWVPLYNIHKMYAGLRDAWLYGGSDTAQVIFLKFCDWGIKLCEGLSDAQMESLLGNEHGGMNEIFADAYQMTGDARYMTVAKRYSHKVLLNAMAAGNDNLDNLHANTQVPKAVGFQRIAELSGDNTYTQAGNFFWETVTGNRSLAFGGNSRREYFPPASACGDYVSVVEGPESCNTNNMLKLTEHLFRQNPQAKYADFYERALYNHILSTQHPDHGGYVYFTPARPRHYRVYSAPNMAMWCCVGTGMENHGKYGEFIYTHQNDSLFLNLFIASELYWADKGIRIKQETNFPEEEYTKLTVTEGSSEFKLMIRYPSWVSAGALKVIVNNDTLSYTGLPSSYIEVDRVWSAGDSVKVVLPMHNTVEQLPNVPTYVAFMHGPILLGAKTCTGDLAGLIAGDGRWEHIAGGQLLSVLEAPIIIDDEPSTVSDKLVAEEGEPLTFTAPGLNFVNPIENLEFEPFYKIHDSRYMMYWMDVTNSQYEDILDSLAEIEDDQLELENRTIDFVATGEQQPEADHDMQTLNSYSGTHMNEFWRDARDGGYFSYHLSTNNETNLSLMVRYWGNEGGYRTFDILIDGDKLVTENVTGKWNVNEFRNVEYDIPNSMVESKENIRVKFQAPSSGIAGGAFYIRLLRENSSLIVRDNDTLSQEEILIQGLHGEITISRIRGKAQISIFDLSGRLVKKEDASSQSLNVTVIPGIYLVNVSSDNTFSERQLVVVK